MNNDMNNKLRIALIPAYEPDWSLMNLLHEIQAAEFKAIVIDDGSGILFSDIFNQAQTDGLAVVLTHSENCGKGRAIKTGLHYIEKNFAYTEYTVVTMDSDGQHKVSDAVKVCEEAERCTDTLVLGSRELRDNTPLRSRFGNAVTRFVYSLTTNLRVHDTQTGLRAFSSAILSELINISGERYEYEMNVLLEFARKKIQIKEITVSTVYIDNNSGSHFNALKDSYRIYREIIKFSVSSLVSFLVDYFLYSLLIVLTGGLSEIVSIRLSNIIARIFSASLNYTINRKIVFKSQKSVLKSAIQYFTLAVAILIGNTLLIGVLVENLYFNKFAAKLIAEIVFFMLSWLVQRIFIFTKREIIHDKYNENK